MPSNRSTAASTTSATSAPYFCAICTVSTSSSSWLISLSFVNPHAAESPFQRMHRAAHTTDQFFVARLFLQLQPGVVDHLQHVRGALKEERAEFCSPILGQKTQAVTSIRL